MRDRAFRRQQVEQHIAQRLRAGNRWRWTDPGEPKAVARLREQPARKVWCTCCGGNPRRVVHGKRRLTCQERRSLESTLEGLATPPETGLA